MKNFTLGRIAEALYRIMEVIDEERGLHIVSYQLGEKIKLLLLLHILE